MKGQGLPEGLELAGVGVAVQDREVALGLGVHVDRVLQKGGGGAAAAGGLWGD
jgi:hypothetical protein